MEQVVVGKVAFRNSAIHGTGCFALTTIRKGSKIIEYVGELIDKQESTRRCEEDNRYIFELNDTHDIDGLVDWNPARWINHSCEPNAETEIDEHDRIWVLALRTIRKGDEVTFNYNYGLENYRDYPCQCGSEKCVGFIVGDEHHDRVRRDNKKLTKTKRR